MTAMGWSRRLFSAQSDGEKKPQEDFGILTVRVGFPSPSINCFQKLLRRKLPRTHHPHSLGAPPDHGDQEVASRVRHWPQGLPGEGGFDW